MSLGYCKNGAHDCSYPTRGLWCWSCVKDDEADHARATEWATVKEENARLKKEVADLRLALKTYADRAQWSKDDSSYRYLPEHRDWRVWTCPEPGWTLAEEVLTEKDPAQ